MKIKIGIKQIFKYAYFATAMICLVLLFWVYDFAKKNVFEAINPEVAILVASSGKKSQDINVKKFNDVIEKIKQKTNNRPKPAPSSVKNIPIIEEQPKDAIASSSDN